MKGRREGRIIRVRGHHGVWRARLLRMIRITLSIVMSFGDLGLGLRSRWVDNIRQSERTRCAII